MMISEYYIIAASCRTTEGSPARPHHTAVTSQGRHRWHDLIADARQDLRHLTITADNNFYEPETLFRPDHTTVPTFSTSESEYKQVRTRVWCEKAGANSYKSPWSITNRYRVINLIVQQGESSFLRDRHYNMLYSELECEESDECHGQKSANFNKITSTMD